MGLINYLVYLLIFLVYQGIMKPSKQIGDIRLIERMSKEQIQDYWLELKEARYDSYYYKELFEKIKKMNPNLILPAKEDMQKIEDEAKNIALWEENWDRMNEERINRGGIDYSIFKGGNMWLEKAYKISTNE